MADKENIVSPQARIEFQEVSQNASDFLHELNDPDLLRSREIPNAVKLELRKHQISRLRATVSVLTAKREEFNRKMEEYVGNLQQLVATLQAMDADDEASGGGAAGPPPPASESTDSPVTRVSCLRCETERRFDGLKVVFARESEESLTHPTELYVLESGSLKKGHFQCLKCGTGSLVIKAS